MSQNCKYYKQKRQVSYDNGVTFVDVVPAEFRKGELIESASTDCNSSPSSGYSTQYLTFEAISAGTFSFSGSSSSTINNSSIQYSLDSGSTWYTLNRGVQSPTVSAGQKIMWKSSTLTPIAVRGIGRFSSTNTFNVEGNIMSLLYGDNFIGKNNLSEYSNSFKDLFYNCANLISAENLVLPATTLVSNCYSGMFLNCTSLTSTPDLPATTLANYCYESMFANCTSLTTAPVLSATTLAESCYNQMFGGCTGLTTAPELPATTLAVSCYNAMFTGCTSLTTAPELPATTLTKFCYNAMFAGCTSLTTAPVLSATTLAILCCNYMFEGCTSLTTAPVLYATTLVSNCYYEMFKNCTSLSYVKCLATDISATNCTYAWLYGVSSSGTFVKNSSMSSWESGDSGIPSNWTVQNA